MSRTGWAHPTNLVVYQVWQPRTALQLPPRFVLPLRRHHAASFRRKSLPAELHKASPANPLWHTADQVLPPDRTERSVSGTGRRRLSDRPARRLESRPKRWTASRTEPRLPWASE